MCMGMVKYIHLKFIPAYLLFSRVNSPGNTSYIHISGNQGIKDYLEHNFYDPPEVAKPLVWCH
jgi:hypothetical protein